MANYDQIWGSARKDWCSIDLQQKQISGALYALAWMGMISFFVFGAFSMVTRPDWAVVGMIAALLVWVGAGIAIIRIKRTHKRQITLDV